MTRREIRELYANTVDSIRSGAVSTPDERRLARALINQHIATSQDGARHVATVSAPIPEQMQMTLPGFTARYGLVA
jgi:hypothetical protein